MACGDFVNLTIFPPLILVDPNLSFRHVILVGVTSMWVFLNYDGAPAHAAGSVGTRAHSVSAILITIHCLDCLDSLTTTCIHIPAFTVFI